MTITKERVGERLDKFLVGALGDFSRGQIQRLIKSEAVTVNGKAAPPHYFLKESDVVEADMKQGLGKKNKLKQEPTEKAALDFPIKVIAETPDYLVIDKPAGLITHGGEGARGATLVDWLLEHYPETKKVGEDPERPGIVHRLDREASGLLVVARRQNFFDVLKKQFQERKVKKKYLALVFGCLKKDAGVIDFPLQRAQAGYKMAALPKTVKGELNIKGRRAITEFAVVKKFVNYTLLEVKIKTGRTHQIRAHLAAYGAPLVGDDLYGTAKTRLKNKKISLGRIFLVAQELAFKDLNGEKKRFKINLPEDLKKFLKNIK